MGKAKDGSECYTRQNKSGANYVTCEGTQKKRAARRKLKAGGAPPVLTKPPPKPTGFIAGPPLPPRTSDSGGAGVVMPEGPSASFEGLFGSVAPVEPEEAEQGVNEDILAEVIPGLFEGMGSGFPIGERPVYTGDFLEALSVMTETGKERGKSTAADIDERVMISKGELPDTQEFTPVGLMFEGRLHSSEEFERLRDIGWKNINSHPNWNYQPNNLRRDAAFYYKPMRQSDRDELVEVIRGSYSKIPTIVFAFKDYDGNSFVGRRIMWDEDERYRYPLDDLTIPKYSKSIGFYTGSVADDVNGFEYYVNMYKRRKIYLKRQALADKYKKLKVAELRAKLTKDEAKGLKKLDLVWAIIDKEAPDIGFL